MKPRLKTILMLTLTLIFLLALAACQQPTQAPATETAPTQAATATSADPQATATKAGSDNGYPAATATAAQQPGGAYPPPGSTDPGTGEGDNSAYPPPSSGVPAAPNLSIVTATLEEQAMDDQMAGYMRLLVVINTSEAAPGMVSRTDDLVNQGINLYTLAGSMPVLQPGDTFTAEVEFRGDENGGRFIATKIEKQ